MDPSKGSIFKTYDKPKGYSASNSFATFMIIGRKPIFPLQTSLINQIYSNMFLPWDALLLLPIRLPPPLDIY